jgi:hypothetical protein
MALSYPNSPVFVLLDKITNVHIGKPESSNAYKHHNVHFKYIQFLFFSYISIKLRKQNIFRMFKEIRKYSIN